MNPGCVSRQPPQTAPHIIMDDTGFMPPDTHPYYVITIKVTVLHRYNTRYICLKFHNLMASHVTTIATPRKVPTPAPINRTVHQKGEYEMIINSAKG